MQPPKPVFMLKKPNFWHFQMTLTFGLEVKVKVKVHWWLSWRPHVSILLSFEDIKEFDIFWWPWPLTLRSSSRSKVTDDFPEDPMSLSCFVLKILRNLKFPDDLDLWPWGQGQGQMSLITFLKTPCLYLA